MAVLSRALALAEVRRVLNEPTESIFTDAQIGDGTDIRSWLDRGARCVSALTLCEPTSESVSPIVNQMEYTLSEDYIKISAVVYHDGTDNEKGLQRFDIRGLGHVCASTIGEPKFWYRHGPQLFVYPAPNSAIADGAYVYKVYGYKCVEEYHTDGTNLPDYLNYYAIIYAVAQAYIKDGKHGKAAQYMKRFMNGCMFHRRDRTDQINNLDTTDMRDIPDITIPAQQ